MSELGSLAAAELALLRVEDKRLELQKLESEFAEARSRLIKDGCSHPVDRRGTFQWEHDNGYGRQSMNTGQFCQLCGEEDPYNRWKS